MLMERFGLGEALKEAAGKGMPIWGTCMGMILMAREVKDRPHQYRLGILDIEVERNAFGAQVHSFEQEIAVAGLDHPLNAVFIRAPAVARLGASVEALAKAEGRIVAVRQGRRLGTSFHPELTDDTRLHELFLNL
jgi:pyridoxal 5'-phosphate synthase pdxT subunit